MTTPLIPVTRRQVGEATVQAVNARDLHAFLGVGKVFGAWITERIEQFGFQEHGDYEVFSEIGNNPMGGRPAKEYALALGMAKELAMVERTDKGKQARLYFIECERLAQDPIHCLLTMSRPEMLEMAAGLAREKQALATKVKVQAEELAAVQPKVEFHDRVTASQGGQPIQEVAKVLGVGPVTFFRWLRTEKIIYGDACLPFQDYLDRGYFQVREGTRINHLGRDQAFTRTYFTGKGIVWIQKRWDDRLATLKATGCRS